MFRWLPQQPFGDRQQCHAPTGIVVGAVEHLTVAHPEMIVVGTEHQHRSAGILPGNTRDDVRAGGVAAGPRAERDRDDIARPDRFRAHRAELRHEVRPGPRGTGGPGAAPFHAVRRQRTKPLHDACGRDVERHGALRLDGGDAACGEHGDGSHVDTMVEERVH